MPPAWAFLPTLVGHICHEGPVQQTGQTALTRKNLLDRLQVHRHVRWVSNHGTKHQQGTRWSCSTAFVRTESGGSVSLARLTMLFEHELVIGHYSKDAAVSPAHVPMRRTRRRCGYRGPGAAGAACGSRATGPKGGATAAGG